MKVPTYEPIYNNSRIKTSIVYNWIFAQNGSLSTEVISNAAQNAHLLVD